jgi:hypothetical protein
MHTYKSATQHESIAHHKRTTHLQYTMTPASCTTQSWPDYSTVHYNTLTTHTQISSDNADLTLVLQMFTIFYNFRNATKVCTCQHEMQVNSNTHAPNMPLYGLHPLTLACTCTVQYSTVHVRTCTVLYVQYYTVHVQYSTIQHIQYSTVQYT